MSIRAFAFLLFEVWLPPRNRRHVVRLCLVAYLEVAATHDQPGLVALFGVVFVCSVVYACRKWIRS